MVSPSLPESPGVPACPLCENHTDCSDLAAAAGALAAACLDGRCVAARVGPPLVNHTDGPLLRSVYLSPDGVAAPAAVVLEAESEAGLTIRATAFWEAALCRPGQASKNSTWGVNRGPLPFVAYQPGPPVQVPVTGVAQTAAAAALAGSELVVGGCASCPRGSWTITMASTACLLCAAGTFASKNGSTGCVACAAGSYAPLPGGAAVCRACPAVTPTTLHSRAVTATACFAASIAVPRAWAVGPSLSFVLDWSFAPANAAGAADVVSLVKLSDSVQPDDLKAMPNSDGGTGRRQLAWAYVSMPASPVDTDPDPGPAAEPGHEAMPVGSRTFTIPSAGPGIYVALLYRNSTGPAVPGLVSDGGDIVAFKTFQIGGTSPTLILKGGKGPPEDVATPVVGGGLVCPAGSISLLPGVGWPPCSPCPQGTAAATAGSTVCAECPIATYADRPVTGASACIACPTGPTPPAGSPLLQPEWAGACRTCNLCCSKTCYRNSSNTFTTSPMKTARSTTPSQKLVTTSAGSVTTKPEVKATSKAVSTTQLHLDSPLQSTPPPLDEEKGWQWTCGNGVLNVYETPCWYYPMVIRSCYLPLSFSSPIGTTSQTKYH
jgi:hypothetical protein